MPIQVTMPRLSDTMQQGTIVKWNVAEGQKVKSGDIIADIETDKATMELQTFDAGTVASLSVPEGQTVAVGTVIALLAGAGEDAGSVKASGGGAASQGAKKTGAASSTTEAKPAAPTRTELAPVAEAKAPEPAAANGAGERVFASPLAKKIAAESGVDLRGVSGTGPAGRITSKDVEAAAVSKPARGQPVAPGRSAPALAGKVVPLSNMRRVIARRLVESKTTIPHYQVTVEADMDALMALRAQLNEQLESQGVKLSVNDFLVRACALAMHENPYVNSRWVGASGEESIELIADVNVGVAIALPEERGGGLVVATIRQADQIGLRQISAQSRSLAEKARGKGLSPEEMSDSTFTISNLGMFGVDHFTAIINPPNVAILAVGAAMEKPVVRNGSLAVGHVMSMTMSSDHRVVDGAMAAKYLAAVKGLLEKPATLLV